MEPQLKSSDNILKELLGERRKEVQDFQKRQADQLKEVETRGQQRLAALMGMLNKDNADLMQKLNKMHAEQETKAASALQDIRRKHAAAPKSSIATEKYPGLRESDEANQRSAGGADNYSGSRDSGGRSGSSDKSMSSLSGSGQQSGRHEGAESAERGVAQPALVGWKNPYYGTLHGSDGSVYWQGYNPGNIDLWDSASGSGSGLFGTGAASFTVYMDWWFAYTTETSRFYNNAIYVPFHGFDIVQADDGFWDSKEAHVRIDLSAMGYQYNGKPTANANVFDVDSQNINVNDRYDGWRSMNYSDLLGGGDTAYLRVTSSFYVYARGGGSLAELNFSDGAANYIGVPQVYVS